MKSYTSIPAILRVNSESLFVASKHYRRAFRCCQPGQDQPDKDTSYVWFDFERDFLLIDYNMTGELWASPEDRLANSANPLLYTTVRWIPDDDVKRIRNLAWYRNPSQSTDFDFIWRLFTGLKKWFLVQELMGSGNILQLRHVENSEASIRRATKYNLVRSYDLSFCDVKGADHVDVQECIRLFDTAKMSYGPLLGPLELPSLPGDFKDVTYLAKLSDFGRILPTRNLRKFEIDGKHMVNLRLKAKFEEERKLYEAYIRQNLKNHNEHRSEDCNCKVTELRWLRGLELVNRYFIKHPPRV
ncbi:uncharacterized protein EAE97_007948 [Botrytis byssoidea]|uniref:2EXR domain-containing protein n=1 Tax=Botrytis byssoidea TaxID=139641 RepID=A0A9P5IBH4_9HELO|nr:uncharacterized protein EAE97_007948 [Botrytis byssoidea]KAF7936582.1 hypothetical protein EAE97_007948 [Botrytis byssoidea]